MLPALRVEPGGAWVDTVTLAFDDRHRRRLRLVCDGGLEVLLDLPQARVLRDGDRLVLTDGRRVLVRAADEDVLEVEAATPVELARLAWHLGNRHTPMQVLDGRLRLRADHVLEAMLRGLGATVIGTRAPFDPEGGAYAGHDHTAGSHGHDHNDELHAHDHDRPD